MPFCKCNTTLNLQDPGFTTRLLSTTSQTSTGISISLVNYQIAVDQV